MFRALLLVLVLLLLALLSKYNSIALLSFIESLNAGSGYGVFSCVLVLYC